MEDANHCSMMSDTTYYPWVPDLDDWKHIVRAVNNFEAMREALRKLAADMDRGGGDGYGMPECPWCHAEGMRDGDNTWHQPDCELEIARAALALAEQEP